MKNIGELLRQENLGYGEGRVCKYCGFMGLFGKRKPYYLHRKNCIVVLARREYKDILMKA